MGQGPEWERDRARIERGAWGDDDEQEKYNRNRAMTIPTRLRTEGARFRHERARTNDGAVAPFCLLSSCVRLNEREGS